MFFWEKIVESQDIPQINSILFAAAFFKNKELTAMNAIILYDHNNTIISHVLNILDGLEEFLKCNPVNEIPAVQHPDTKILCHGLPSVPNCLYYMSGLMHCSKCLENFELLINWTNESPDFTCLPMNQNACAGQGYFDPSNSSCIACGSGCSSCAESTGLCDVCMQVY